MGPSYTSASQQFPFKDFETNNELPHDTLLTLWYLEKERGNENCKPGNIQRIGRVYKEVHLQFQLQDHYFLPGGPPLQPISCSLNIRRQGKKPQLSNLSLVSSDNRPEEQIDFVLSADRPLFRIPVKPTYISTRSSSSSTSQEDSESPPLPSPSSNAVVSSPNQMGGGSGSSGHCFGSPNKRGVRPEFTFVFSIKSEKVLEWKSSVFNSSSSTRVLQCLKKSRSYACGFSYSLLRSSWNVFLIDTTTQGFLLKEIQSNTHVEHLKQQQQQQQQQQQHQQHMSHLSPLLIPLPHPQQQQQQQQQQQKQRQQQIDHSAPPAFLLPHSFPSPSTDDENSHSSLLAAYDDLSPIKRETKTSGNLNSSLNIKTSASHLPFGSRPTYVGSEASHGTTDDSFLPSSSNSSMYLGNNQLTLSSSYSQPFPILSPPIQTLSGSQLPVFYSGEYSALLGGLQSSHSHMSLTPLHQHYQFFQHQQPQQQQQQQQQQQTSPRLDSTPPPSSSTSSTYSLSPSLPPIQGKCELETSGQAILSSSIAPSRCSSSSSSSSLPTFSDPPSSVDHSPFPSPMLTSRESQDLLSDWDSNQNSHPTQTYTRAIPHLPHLSQSFFQQQQQQQQQQNQPQQQQQQNQPQPHLQLHTFNHPLYSALDVAQYSSAPSPSSSPISALLRSDSEGKRFLPSFQRNQSRHLHPFESDDNCPSMGSDPSPYTC